MSDNGDQVSPSPGSHGSPPSPTEGRGFDPAARAERSLSPGASREHPACDDVRERAEGEGAFALREPEGDKDSALTKLCKSREAFETPEWAARAILRNELMTPFVVDPCCGLFMLTRAANAVAHEVLSIDVEDWSSNFETLPPHITASWLSDDAARGVDDFAAHNDFTVFMNPPFSLACDFVDRAFRLGARKVLCFQRLAWRESNDRRAWFEQNPPARTWMCGARATSWRFDQPQRIRGEKGGTTAHAWFIWERGHRGLEATHMLWPEKDEGQGVLL